MTGFLELERERRRLGQCVGCGLPKAEGRHEPDCWTLRFERDPDFGTEYDDSEDDAS
jgi:hypothetical protein